MDFKFGFVNTNCQTNCRIILIPHPIFQLYNIIMITDVLSINYLLLLIGNDKTVEVTFSQPAQGIRTNNALLLLAGI